MLWLDAHGDINTPITSPTGNRHGMPVASLLGLFDQKQEQGFEWFDACLNPEDIIYIGIRDLDPGEINYLEKNSISYYTTKEINKIGLSQLFNNIKSQFKNYPIHISFDIDSIDSKYVSATGTPVKDGLTPSQALDILEHVLPNYSVTSMELVEFNPLLYCGDHSFECTWEIIESTYSLYINHLVNKTSMNNFLSSTHTSPM